MTKKNRTLLKDHFKRGDIPTQEHFADLIDSMLNQEDDKIDKSSDGTLCITGPLSVSQLGAKEPLVKTTESKVVVNGELVVTGNVSTDAALNFGAQVRQMINLWNTTYGIGVQDATQYFRTNGNFAWYKGGVHAVSALDPGTNGTALMVLKDGNLGIGTNAPVAKLQVTDGAIMPSAGNDENAGIFFPKDPYGGSGDRAWMRYYARSGEAMTLEIGTSDNADDHIALMPSGGVGIGTITPSAKLEVSGDFIRKIAMATGLGPNDETDKGQIVSRVLKFTKRYDKTAIRIFYCDNLRVWGDDVSARWEIRIDGQTVPGGGLYADKYGNAGNRHEPTTILGYATGVSAGAHEIQIWVGQVPEYARNTNTFTGWCNSRWTIEAQEVWL